MRFATSSTSWLYAGPLPLADGGADADEENLSSRSSMATSELKPRRGVSAVLTGGRGRHEHGVSDPRCRRVVYSVRSSVTPHRHAECRFHLRV